MSSMNNWLAFSLSPQQLPSQTENHTQSSTSRLGFNSDDDCFDLSSDSTAPSLNLPSSFGILEAFNNTNHESNEWNNVKDMSSMSCDTNNFKPTSSEYSMFLGGGISNSNIVDHQEEPKLEDFLGGHSFSGHECNNSNNHPMTATGDYMFSHDQSHGHGAANSNSIGLSMIKTWLRNQPAPTQSQPPQLEKNNSICTSGGGNTTQTLSLSMGTGSQPATTIAAASGGNGVESCSSDNTQIVKTTSTTSLDSQTGAIEAVLPPRKSIDTFGQRTSIYRGVTRHRWTGRYEAHLWDNSCRREGQTRKGRQVYLGGYDKEEKAARAYDLAALKYWGSTTTTNFPISNYEKELEDMKVMNRQEYVASLRRKSSGFSRGASIYRGVTRHHQHGRWQARIGRVAGNKDLYLGTFSTQEEAAEAYDIAAIKFRGLNAVTNFEMNRYDVNSIMESSTLPIGGNAKRLKEAEHQLIEASTSVDGRRTDDDNITSQLTEGGVLNSYGTSNHYHHHPWSSISFNQAQPLSIMNYPSYGSGQQRGWCKQEQDVVFQDLHQLQLASTHNFFQPSNVLHNLMSLDSSSMEHSSGSNSVIYSSGSGSGGGSNGSFQGGNHGGYVMPMGMVIDDQSTHNHATCFGEHEAKQLGYDTLLTSTADPYNHQSSNPYYPTSQQHQSSTQGPPGSNNWIPTALQTLTPRTNSLSLCHGGVPAFTVWNDT